MEGQHRPRCTGREVMINYQSIGEDDDWDQFQGHDRPRTCAYCNTRGLHWAVASYGGWRLFNEAGEIHVCERAGGEGMSRTTIKDYLTVQRFSETNHLGLGDIRLTIAQQEEIEQIEADLLARVAELEAVTQAGMTLIAGDAVGLEWKRGCHEWLKAARSVMEKGDE